jgi:4-hydroxybenzoate polyprenyltransferase
MSRRIDLLRLEYAFSVIVPCLLAVYFNNFNLFAHLDIIGGFLLYAITGNLLNDAIDAKDPKDVETKERVQGYRPKEIMAMGLIAFLFGTFLFVRTCVDHWENTILLIVIVVMVVGYCLKFKQWVIINQILLAVSHVLLPYFMVEIDGGVTTFGLLDWVLILTFFAYAYTGQIVHEAIDGDAITRFSLRTQQIIVWVSSLITTGLGIVANFVLWSTSTPEWYIFLPMIFVPLGTIYIFRRPKQHPKGVKDIGIVLGNILMLYILVLIVRQMWA